MRRTARLGRLGTGSGKDERPLGVATVFGARLRQAQRRRIDESPRYRLGS